MTAERAIEECGRLAFSDMREFFDADSNLKPIHELTQAQGAVLAGWVTLKTKVRDGGSSNTIHRIKFWDKVRALEMLFKHFGLLKGCVELTDTGPEAWGVGSPGGSRAGHAGVGRGHRVCHATFTMRREQ